MVWETRGKEPRDRRCWRRRAGLLFVAAGCVAALIAVVGGSAVGASGHRRVAVGPRGVSARVVPRPSPALLAKARAGAARERSRRGSRAARLARVRSRRAYAHVSRDGAVGVARRQAGGVVGSAVWAPLRLRRGERLLGGIRRRSSWPTASGHESSRCCRCGRRTVRVTSRRLI